MSNRRSFPRQVGLATLALLLAACSPAAPPAVPLASPEPARAATLRIELAEASDVTDIPRHMAVEALRAQGYEVEILVFEDDNLPFVAMEKGELDLLTAPDALALVAIGQGAPAFIALDDSANTFLVAAVQDIQQCSDLAGRPVALNNLTGGNANLLYRYIDKECPGTQPQYLVISKGTARLAALYAGEVDALSLNLYDYLLLEPEQLEKVHALVFYSEEFPGFSPLSTYMRRGLAQEYPETAKDVIRALLEARRKLQDPQVLADEIVSRLELPPDQARQLAETYLERKTWDVNGRYTLEAVQEKIQWHVDSGTVPADTQAADVADLSFLEAVLAEIGRQ